MAEKEEAVGWRGLRDLFEEGNFADHTADSFALALDGNRQLVLKQEPRLASRTGGTYSSDQSRDGAGEGSTEYESATGACVWDSSIVCSKYLERIAQESPWPWKRVLELGAGCGLAGITAKAVSPSDTSVLCTDRDEILPLLKLNVSNNHTEESDIRAQKLIWGKDHNSLGLFDLIIACDLVYDINALPDLLKTLVQRCSKTGRVLMTIDHSIQRPTVISKFHEMYEMHFSRQDVPTDQLHPSFIRPSVHIFYLIPTTP